MKLSDELEVAKLLVVKRIRSPFRKRLTKKGQMTLALSLALGKRWSEGDSYAGLLLRNSGCAQFLLDFVRKFEIPDVEQPVSATDLGWLHESYNVLEKKILRKR